MESSASDIAAEINSHFLGCVVRWTVGSCEVRSYSFDLSSYNIQWASDFASESGTGLVSWKGTATEDVTISVAVGSYWRARATIQLTIRGWSNPTLQKSDVMCSEKPRDVPTERAGDYRTGFFNL